MFNALTENDVLAANYPFAAIGPAPAIAANPAASLRSLHARVQTLDRRELKTPAVTGAAFTYATEEITTGHNSVLTIRWP